jgi:septum site-determining protein MinD
MSGHILAVFSGKGGVGKSTFVMNLAIAFEKHLRLRTCVVDLDHENFGDQELLIGTRGNRFLTDLCKAGNRLEEGLLKQHLVKYSQGGVNLLNLAATKADLEYLEDDNVEKTLDILTKLHKIVIVDCGSTIAHSTLKVFEKCSGIYLVTEQDMLAINATKRAIKELNTYSFMAGVVKPILNKYHDSKIGRSAVQQQIRIPLVGIVPLDNGVGNSVLQGVPMVLASSRSRYSQGIVKIATDLVKRGVLQSARNENKPKADRKSLIKATTPGASQADSEQGFRRAVKVDPKFLARNKFKETILRKLVDTMDLKEFDPTKQDPKEVAVLQEKTKRAIVDLLDKNSSPFNQPANRSRLLKELLDEALRLGPLEDLLADPTVSEVMVNGVNQVYVERDGKLTLSDVTFVNEEQLLKIIERIVAPLGRRIDEKTPYVDARLKTGAAAGSRVHAIIPPLAIDGPTITIRKFKKDGLTYKNLIEYGTLSKEIVEFLRLCVREHRNIIISGGTGSGKTTLLNILSSFIPNDERIITVEDAAELQLTQDHVARLETRGPSIEGTGAVGIRDLVRQSLRMRSDRFIVGECRGGEALDMLQAMNTGHDGSLTTVHANTPRDAVARLETLVMMSGLELPSKAIKEQIASAIHIIVQQSRFSDGSRKISAISEITGMEGEKITMQPIFEFREAGLDKRYKVMGKFNATGFIPKFIEEVERRGKKVPRGIFIGKS